MKEQEMKIKIEELEAELQQYKAFVADIKEYLRGYDVLEHFRAMINDYGFQGGGAHGNKCKQD